MHPTCLMVRDVCSMILDLFWKEYGQIHGTFVVNADLPTSPRSPISGEPRINVKSQDFAGTSSKCKNSHRRDLKNVSNLKKQEKVSMARTRSKSKFEEELKQKAGVSNSDPKEELD